MEESDKPSAETLQKARAAVQRSREKQQALVTFRAMLVAVPVFVIYSFFSGKNSDPPRDYSTPTCHESDARCQSDRLLSSIISPCTKALEAQLSYIPTWTDSFSKPRFIPGGWYQPNYSFIYTGNQIEVVNAFGARAKAQYFCVVSSDSHQVLKVGFPTL